VQVIHDIYCPPTKKRKKERIIEREKIEKRKIIILPWTCICFVFSFAAIFYKLFHFWISLILLLIVWLLFHVPIEAERQR
jgi:hypothetical protein